jgi:hypothetical protein
MKRIGFLAIAVLVFTHGDPLGGLRRCAALVIAAGRYMLHAEHLFMFMVWLMVCSCLLWVVHHG